MHTEPQPASPGTGPSFGRALGLIFLGGLALRAAFLLLEPSTFPVGDERTYLTWGTQYLPSARVAFSPFRMHLIFHPPLYMWLLGSAFRLFGESEVVVREPTRRPAGRERDRPEARQRILDAAEERFAQDGFDATPTARISGARSGGRL